MSDNLDILHREFPDFDMATLPSIPETFTCYAWHQDSCPVWYDGNPAEPKAGLLMLAIDFDDPELREYPESERFTLHLSLRDGQYPSPLMFTNKWEDIKAALKAIAYIRQLGLAFHPDTRGADYLDQGHRPTFTPEQAADYDATITALCATPADQYEFGLAVWRSMGHDV